MAFSAKKEAADAKEREVTQSRFVNLLKKYKILFNKSNLSTIKAKKNNAITNLQRDYSKAFGKAVTVKHLKRKMQNMKSEILKKVNSTEDNKFVLNKWESHLYDLMVKSNGIQIKLPVKKRDPCDDTETTLNSFVETEDTQPRTKRPERKKQSSFSSEPLNDLETEETRTLSTNELQRLVLLEQLKLARIKIAKEEGWVHALAQKNKKTRRI